MATHTLSRQKHRRFSLAQMLRHFLARRALRRDRKRLALLDDHLLRDIGISREAALLEADRRDWGAPDHWLR